MCGPRSIPRLVDPLALFALAFAVRESIVLHSRGGPFGNFGYDAGVYYSAADALIHGRMPYADFTLLHPPALVLALTPFAFLGTLTSDHLGFVVANTAFGALGALNAVLVLLVARRAGAGRFAAVVGGLFYALWPGAAGAEISVRLEPLGNLLLLCGLLVLRCERSGATGRRRLLLGGALLGAAAVTKIWWIVPLVVLAAWAVRRSGRRGLLVPTGAAVCATVVAGPFFLRSPTVMWRMVVTDQLGRPAIGGSVPSRLRQMTSMSSVLPRVSNPATVLGLALLVTVVLTVFALAWQRAALRPVVTVAAAQLIVLLAAPTYFTFYADYLAPTGALVLAGALAVGHGAPPARARRAAGVAAVAVLTVCVTVELVVDAPSAISPFPGARLARATAHAHVRCVMADSPMALIELDVLSTGLADGCPNRVDVSGSTYDVDRPPGGRQLPRPQNARWQHDLFRYLTSGNAEIVIRRLTGLSTATRHRLHRFPVIARVGGHLLRRTP